MSRTFPALVLSFLIPCAALSQISGGKDYALGGSSVMWYPRPSALYRNPAELARVHQCEFFLSTNRWSNLSSMTGTYFEPFVGTFAAGIARFGPSTQYTLGYSRIILNQHGAGFAVNVNPDVAPSLSLALGVSAHFADSVSQNSGFHAGLGITSLGPNALPEQLGLSAGAAYWIKREAVRVQGSFLQSTKVLSVVGIEVFPLRWFSVQLSTQSFEKIFGGISVPFQYFQAEFAAGKEGVSLSFNFRISDPAIEQRKRYFDSGMEALRDQRYH
ncbi:MAG TPA: hypothetical protein VI704_07225, partial [Bacteroidota bacterium]|nr:hypothetical protein [Bacteroidota bacterium]